MYCDTSQGRWKEKGIRIGWKCEGEGGREGEGREGRMWTQCLHDVLVYACIHTEVMAADAPLPNNVHIGFFSPGCRRE